MREMTNMEILNECKDEIKEEFKKCIWPDGHGSMSDVDIVLSAFCDPSTLTKDDLNLGIEFYAEAVSELKSQRMP